MLSIFYGDMPDAIYNPVLYFKNTYTDEWIMDDLSKKMIREYYESGKYASLKQTYNELFHIYGREEYTKPVMPDYIIVEDSNSGYEFFAGVMEESDGKVISASGKSNIFSEILKSPKRQVLVIADGAAFGSEMDRVMKLIHKRKGMVLYLPESFEWLILQSGVIRNMNLRKILERPSDFIESNAYFSWERYFSELLMDLTKDTYLKYMKRKLNNEIGRAHV